MQINQSLPQVNQTQQTLPVQQQQGVNRSTVNDERKANVEKEFSRSSEGTANNSQRLQIDQRAIEQLDQALANNSKANQQNQTDYDQPPERNHSAVNAYQSVGNIAQRENLQQLLGVDLYV